MKKIKDYGIEHAGFIVNSLEDAMDHFKKYYEIDDFKIYNFKPNRSWYYGEEQPPGCHMKIAMGSFTDTDCMIELIEPVAGKSIHKDYLDEGNTGIHHLCFKIEDFPYWKNYFLEKGAEILFEVETEDDVVGFRRGFFAKDAITGMIFEIKEIPFFRK